jgi:hypothetical protein
VRGDDLPDALGGGATGIHRSLYGGHISHDLNGDERRVRLFEGYETNESGLEHRIGRLESRNEALGFEQA